MSSSPPHQRHAYVEEYNEEAHTTLPETRQTANVAAKRSRPDISRLKTTELGRDGASDSGSSSHTAATGSGDSSSQGSKTASAALKVEEVVAVTPVVPVGAERKPQSRPKSPPKQPKPPLLQRTSSRAKKREPGSRDHCNCKDCLAPRRATITPAQAPSPSDIYAFARQPRPRHDGPPSPQASRPPPAFYAQEVPVLQPAQPRPRASTSQSYRSSRPASFHAGMMAEPGHLQPVYLERRPPSTYSNPLPFVPPSFPPPGPSYLPTPLPVAPQPHVAYPHPPTPYDTHPRPVIRQYTSEQYQPNSRHSAIYGAPPVVEYSPIQPMYATMPTAHPSSQPLSRRPSSHKPERPSPISPPGEEYYTYAQAEDYYLMPPPASKRSSSQQRPTIRHAATMSAAHPPSHHRGGARESDEQVQERSPRKYSADESRPTSRRPSLASRPSAAPTASSSSSKNNMPAAVNLESRNTAPPGTLRRRRPVSYYGHETPHELEKEVEAYQAAQKSKSIALPDPPTIESVQQLTRRKTKTQSSGGSETGSRASEGREDSDVNSKPSSRTAVEKRGKAGTDVKSKREEVGDDGFTMRFDASQGVKFDLKGDSVDGRVISLRQSGEGVGEMELSIGGKQGNSSMTTGSIPRGRERSVRRYSYMGAGKGVQQIEYTRSKSRVGRDGVSETVVETERQRDGMTETVVETERQRGGVRQGVREVVRMVAGSRSRRNSRSVVDGRALA